MSGFKPARQRQPAFYPFKKEKFGSRLLADRARSKRAHLRMSYVRKLPPPGDCLYLSYGVSERNEKRPLRRCNP